MVVVGEREGVLRGEVGPAAVEGLLLRRKRGVDVEGVDGLEGEGTC